MTTKCYFFFIAALFAIFLVFAPPLEADDFNPNAAQSFLKTMTTLNIEEPDVNILLKLFKARKTVGLDNHFVESVERCVCAGVIAAGRADIYYNQLKAECENKTVSEFEATRTLRCPDCKNGISTEVCRSCNGTGKCHLCGGRGRSGAIKCAECNHTGRCWRCKGSGKIKEYCSKCGGTSRVWERYAALEQYIHLAGTIRISLRWEVMDRKEKETLAERERKEQEERAKREQTGHTRKEQKERARKEQAEHERRVQEDRARKEQFERERREQEERARKEQAERERREQEEKARKEQAERERKEQEERARKEQVERERREQEERAELEERRSVIENEAAKLAKQGVDDFLQAMYDGENLHPYFIKDSSYELFMNNIPFRTTSKYWTVRDKIFLGTPRNTSATGIPMARVRVDYLGAVYDIIMEFSTATCKWKVSSIIKMPNGGLGSGYDWEELPLKPFQAIKGLLEEEKSHAHVEEESKDKPQSERNAGEHPANEHKDRDEEEQVSASSQVSDDLSQSPNVSQLEAGTRSDVLSNRMQRQIPLWVWGCGSIIAVIALICAFSLGVFVMREKSNSPAINRSTGAMNEIQTESNESKNRNEVAQASTLSLDCDDPQQSPNVSPAETLKRSKASSTQTRRRRNSWLVWGCGCVIMIVALTCAFFLGALAISKRDVLSGTIKHKGAAKPDMSPEIKVIIDHAENVRLSFYGFYLGMTEDEVKTLEAYYWPDIAKYDLSPVVSYSISPDTKKVYRLIMNLSSVSELTNGGDSLLELKSAVEKHMNIAMGQASYALEKSPSSVEVDIILGRMGDGFIHNDDGSLANIINGYEYQTIHQTTVFITDLFLIIEDWREREALDRTYGYGEGDGQSHSRFRKLSGQGVLDF